jgi:hypothetical protein
MGHDRGFMETALTRLLTMRGEGTAPPKERVELRTEV